MDEERPREGTAWHAIEVDEVARRLETSEAGLPHDEAAARLERYGSNELPEEPPPHPVVLFLHQFKSPLIYILVVAALVTLLLQEFTDAAVIAFVLALNAVIGFIQESRAEASVRALSRLMAPRALVKRDNEEEDVEARNLVPGDVVLLESGVRLPADMRLFATNGLRIDESLLTGESVPVTKSVETLGEDAGLADRSNMALSGSIVTGGRGHGYVVETGTRTEIGTIAGYVRGVERVQTPLEARMATFARIIGVAILAASLLAIAVGLVGGQSTEDMFLVAVGIAVAAIPEGLPIVLTVTLALGVRRMAQRKAIIRRLAAVATLGSTTVIASDKTGTLTENRMEVQRLWTSGNAFEVRGEDRAELLRDGQPVDAEQSRPLHLTLLAGILTNEATLHDSDNGTRGQGDPTEVALLMAPERLGMSPGRLRKEHRIVDDLPFEPDLQYSATVREHDGETILYLKGAPERVLDMCSGMLTDDGVVDLDRDAVLDQGHEMAGEGLRVLGMAYLPVEGGQPPNLHELSNLVFLGLQGMMDPPRAEVADAIARSHEAGIRVVMVTGDHAGTATAIAQILGIVNGGHNVLIGRDIEQMSDEELERATPDTAVFARVSPEHKLRIVRALQANGETVAVTGDGVNDAPALRAADIGIAMGQGGTDVAREASDMVLADDNFVSITAAVEEGRNTFTNVRLVTFFLVSTGAGLVGAVLAALFLGWPILFLPTQLLWLNLVTNGLQDVALAFERGQRDIMRRAPRPRSEGIISPVLWERVAIAGIVMAIGTLVMFRLELDRTDSEELARSAALTTVVLFQAIHLGNSRSENLTVFGKTPWSNRFLFVATSAALTIHAVALYLPPTQYLLRVEPIELSTWFTALLIALSVIVVCEIHKAIRDPDAYRGHPAPAAPVTGQARREQA